jgi:hypothetical protein
MDSLTLLAPETAQAASAPSPAAKPARAAMSVDAFAAALGLALAVDHPSLAASIEANLERMVDQPLTREGVSADSSRATLEWFRDMIAGAQIIASRPAETVAPQPDANAPEATPDRVMWRVQTAALLRVLGPKKGQRFLREMAGTLANEQALTDVVPIRATALGWHKVRDAQLGAIALFRNHLSHFVAAANRGR